MDQYDRGQPEYAERSQWNQDGDQYQGQADVLQHDGPCAAGVGQGVRQVAQVLTHESDVGGLDGHVAAHRTHRDADVGGGQGRRVVDAVADHRGRPVLA